jgi:hypothetical protein
MRQYLVQVEESACEKFEGMIDLCPDVKIVGVDVVIDTKDVVDQCVCSAINSLVESNTIRHAYDYAYIMMGINQGLVDKQLFFVSPQEYLDYLNELVDSNLPGKSTLYNTIGKTYGKYPDWTFTDKPTTFESLRRKNVFKQFLSAFMKEKRARLERMLENKKDVGMDSGK